MDVRRKTLANLTDTQIAWKAVKNLQEKFNFSEDEIRILLGEMPRATFYKGIKNLEGGLNRDVKERISFLLGIYKALRILFVDSAQAMSWINRDNILPPFNGKTPREYLMQGSILRLAEVRKFLDFWRGY